MLIPKIIETRLDIKNINDMYTTNYNSMIMRYLQNKFLNKCYKSILIKKIVQIIRRGRIVCVASSLTGDAYVDVAFEVEGYVFLPNEIIQKCKIEKIIGKDRKTMFLETDLCSIQVDYKTQDIFKIKDEIPVIVKRTRYNINSNKVSILAQDFFPNPILSTYYVIKNNDTEAAPDNVDFIDDFQSLKNKLKEYDQEDVEFFIKLAYPYIDESIPYGHINGEKMSIDEFDKLSEGDVIYLSDNYLDEFIFYKIDSHEESILIEMTKQNLYKHMADMYLLNLYNLIGFLDTYPKSVREKIDKDSTIIGMWKLYEKNKFQELNSYEIYQDDKEERKALYNPIREVGGEGDLDSREYDLKNEDQSESKELEPELEPESSADKNYQ